jgi:hypothetical protein
MFAGSLGNTIVRCALLGVLLAHSCRGGQENNRRTGAQGSWIAGRRAIPRF